MAKTLRRPLSIALGALAATTLGGCYYGDIYGAGHASAGYACETRYGAGYYDRYDPYAYDDGYGYDCYDGGDYGGGFVQIGFGGGWYDDYYYPGYGLWMYDNYRQRYPLRGHYLNYWGGRRAWWKHHKDRGDGHWNRPGRGDHDGRPGRPGGWNQGDRDDDDGPRGTRPGGGRPAAAATPQTPNASQPPRPPRNPAAVRARPRPETIAGDPAPRRPGAIRPAAERPAARNPGGVRASAQPPSPPAPQAAAPRPAAEKPARPARTKGGDRANRVREN